MNTLLSLGQSIHPFHGVPDVLVQHHARLPQSPHVVVDDLVLAREFPVRKPPRRGNWRPVVGMPGARDCASETRDVCDCMFVV